MATNRKFCWIGDEEPTREKRRMLGKNCRRCGAFVRLEDCPIHGVPRADKKIKLSATEMERILKACTRSPTYCFATPLHKRSLVLRDLVAHYGSEEKVKALIGSEDGRIRLVGDILQLRRDTKISVRLSLTRETDRFTVLQMDALYAHELGAARTARYDQLRALYLNAYFGRTALSEASRHALRTRAFPYFDADLFRCPLAEFLRRLCEGYIHLLLATDFAPYAKVLLPMRQWLESGVVYVSRGKNNQSPIEDLVLFAVHIAQCPVDYMLSPRAMERYIVAIPFFSTSRSKEVWLDAVQLLLSHPDMYALTGDEVEQLISESQVVGEPGPGPRRLLRWVAGDAVSKDTFLVNEEEKYAELTEDIISHLQSRLGVVGRVQALFQVCEASKAISDLFANTGIPYIPFAGHERPDEDLVFDEQINAPAAIRRRYLEAVAKVYRRCPSALATLCAVLPQQLALRGP